MGYKLNEHNIDDVCTEADGFLVKSNTESKERTRTRLLIEEDEARRDNRKFPRY